MRIGIFGGTFDPIHFGHLINVGIILEEYRLDKILFVPSKSPVHKETSKITSPEDRCAMVSKAIGDNTRFELSRIEVDRVEPSYTITTVNEIISIYPESSLYLIIGYDSYLEIATWKEYKNLIRLTSFIVMNRPLQNSRREPEIGGFKEILFAKNPDIEISSTYIRERIRGNLSVRYMMPDSVLQYIKTKGLYLPR